MGSAEGITDLFSTKSAKLLVILALTGIALSAYPIYNDLHSNVAQKIELIKEWNSLDFKILQPELMDTMYNQVYTELTGGNRTAEQLVSTFKKQVLPYSLKTCLLKALMGMALYLFIYGTRLLCLVNRRRTNKYIQIIRPVKLFIFSCAFLGVLNAAIPFVSILFNYVFIPSCLTLVFALISMVCAEVNERINEIES
ncbi:MAG: hypothetical protein LBM20_05920 [Rikenellaceae bacterium]|jgi:hypothetical protein|nr:hypothetical protein [Rikenellaceae bacterium]